MQGTDLGMSMGPVKAAWLTYGTGRLGPRGLTVVPTDTTKNVPDLMSQIQHQVCASRTSSCSCKTFEISMKVSFNQSDQTTVIDVFLPSTVVHRSISQSWWKKQQTNGVYRSRSERGSIGLLSSLIK